jgi:hypothetical protein
MANYKSVKKEYDSGLFTGSRLEALDELMDEYMPYSYADFLSYIEYKMPSSEREIY